MSLTSLQEDFKSLGLQDLTEVRTRVTIGAGGKVVKQKLHRQSSAERAAGRASKRKHKATAAKYNRSAKVQRRLAKRASKINRFKAAKGMLECFQLATGGLIQSMAERMTAAVEVAPSEEMHEDLRTLALGSAVINGDTVRVFANSALLAEALSGQFDALAAEFKRDAETEVLADQFAAASDVLAGIAEDAALCARGINVALREGRTAELKVEDVQRQLHETVTAVTQAAALDVDVEGVLADTAALADAETDESLDESDDGDGTGSETPEEPLGESDDAEDDDAEDDDAEDDDAEDDDA